MRVSPKLYSQQGENPIKNIQFLIKAVKEEKEKQKVQSSLQVKKKHKQYLKDKKGVYIL